MWNIGQLISELLKALHVSYPRRTYSYQGPTIGPLQGGFLIKTIGWRFDFWIILAAATPVVVLIELMNKETSHNVLLQQKASRLRCELSREELRVTTMT